MKKIFTIVFSLLPALAFAAPSNPTYGTVTATTVNTGSLSGMGGSIWNFASTDTGTAYSGGLAATDSFWNPPATTGYWPTFGYINLQSISLNGGTVQQRWNTTNTGFQVTMGTTGPSGTPSTPTGMADSHSQDYYAYEEIPAGLCDGQEGNGFTGPGGSPGNNCYQEIANYQGTQIMLSPGDLAEGAGLTISDNLNGTGAVSSEATGFAIGLYKDYAGNPYNWYGFEANSMGTQQTTYAPSAAFHDAGGWQNGLDLSNGVYNNDAILLPHSGFINTDTSNMYLGAANSDDLNISAAGATILNPSNTGNVLTLNATGNSLGALLYMNGNGSNASKTLQVSNGVFTINNNAFSGAILKITDGGLLTAPQLQSGGGTAPTSSVGTPSGTDNDFKVTGLTGVTSLTITFSTAFSNAPYCTGNGVSLAPVVGNASTTAVTFTISSLTGTFFGGCQG